MHLIEQVETDQLVTLSAKAVSNRFTYIQKKNNLPHMSFHDLRHVNASVMAILNVPDKYAMERGGWKTDKIMKSTYMQTFKPERSAVDHKIDEYFTQTILSQNPAAVEYQKKYNSWLILFNKIDCEKSKEEFDTFMKMQHEMQHELKKCRKYGTFSMD